MPVEGAVWSWELESCSNEKKSYVCVCVCVQQKTKQKKDLQMDNGSTGDKKKKGEAHPGLPLATPLWESDGPRPTQGPVPTPTPLVESANASVINLVSGKENVKSPFTGYNVN